MGGRRRLGSMAVVAFAVGGAGPRLQPTGVVGWDGHPTRMIVLGAGAPCSYWVMTSTWT